MTIIMHQSVYLMTVNLYFPFRKKRTNGIKNFNGFPHNAIQRALQWANLTVEDIDIFAFSSLHNPIWRDAWEIKKQYGEPKWKNIVLIQSVSVIQSI